MSVHICRGEACERLQDSQFPPCEECPKRTERIMPLELTEKEVAFLRVCFSCIEQAQWTIDLSSYMTLVNKLSNNNFIKREKSREQP